MNRPRRALVALGVLGVLWAAAGAALLVTGRDADPAALIVLRTLVGVLFLLVGLFVWDRRPDNRMGVILTATGFAWFLQDLLSARGPGLYTAGLLLNGLSLPVSFTLVTFPTGRFVTRLERWVVTAAWLWATVWVVVSTPFNEPPGDAGGNLLLITDVPAVTVISAAGWGLLGAGLVAALVWRWRVSTPPERREMAPVVAAGCTAAGIFAVWIAVFGPEDHSTAADATKGVLMLALCGLALAFLSGLSRARVLASRAVSHLAAALGDPVDAATLQQRLAGAVGDPSLRVLFARAEGDWVDGRGTPASPPDDVRGWVPIHREGRVIGGIVHDPALARHSDLMATAGAAATGLAIENARLEAELRARVAEVSASRSRIVAAGLQERRRLERNLHDGAQQRLVSLMMRLRVARGGVNGHAVLADQLDAAVDELQLAIDELRELARGIHPAVLSDRGLAAALEGLARRAPLPVEVHADPARLPEPVEAAAYFVVAESLTNVARYAHATHAQVRVTRTDGRAVVEVHDDGRGGARADEGSGLAGLSDRVSALGGRLSVNSPPGAGTVVRAEFPCAS